MRNYTHELIGVSLGIAAGQAVGADGLETAGLTAAAFSGSRLPDTDQLGSRVHRRSRLERANLLARTIGLLLRLPVIAFALVARHRGITHSVLACTLVATVVFLVVAPLDGTSAAVVGGGVGIGYGGHLLADARTPSGVPLFSPLVRRRVWLLPRPARIPTGSLRELMLATVAVLATVALLAA